MDVGDIGSPFLAGGNRLDLNVWMTQKDLDQFDGSVTRPTQNRDLGHCLLSLGKRQPV